MSEFNTAIPMMYPKTSSMQIRPIFESVVGAGKYSVMYIVKYVNDILQAPDLLELVIAKMATSSSMLPC